MASYRERLDEVLGQTAQPQAPGTIPPAISQQLGMPSMVPQSVTVGGRRPSIRMAPNPVEMERQKRLMEIENPVPTETERERSPMAASAVAYLDAFAKKLGLTTVDGKPTMQYPEKIAAPMARELVPQKFQDYVMSEDQSMLYNDLESAFQPGSIILTGRQGDLQKLQQIRDVYSFGGAVKNKPKLAYQRYQNLRTLFQMFDRIGAIPPEKREAALQDVSTQMSTLLDQEGIPEDFSQYSTEELQQKLKALRTSR